MLGYIIRRTMQSLVFIFLATLVAYTVIVLLLPYSPASQYSQYSTMKDDPDPQVQRIGQRGTRNLEEYYELDKPWPLNYLAWLFDPSETTELDMDSNEVSKGIDIAIGDLHIRGSGMLTGDFNRSGRIDQRGERVAALIGRAWANTALLVGVALIISILISIPLGIIVAARPHSWLDNIVTAISSIGLSLPAFGLGFLLIIGLAILPTYWHKQLGWEWMPYLPPGDAYSRDQENNLINRLYHIAVPALTLAIPQIAILTKYIRSSMLEVLGLDYIRTAWAKGLPARRVLGRHAFRNALLPLITVITLSLPAVASGTIIVEYVFNYQGMGHLMFKGLGGCVPTEDRRCGFGSIINDPSMVMALLLLLVVVTAISSMLADIMYTVADPRIDQGSKKARTG